MAEEKPEIKIEDGLIRLLCACGWVLLILEIYKQLFLYFIVNDGCFDWWFFPFQLCSVPMYLCVLLPLIRRRSTRLCNAVMTFFACYTFVSSAAALIYPQDFLRSYVSLTVHGFIWHGILLFISLTVVFSHSADLTPKGFAGATALFLALCPFAVIINVIAEPIMAVSPAPHDYAAMFYLNPYHLSPQLLVGSVQQVAGIPAGLVLYVLAIIAASGSICLIHVGAQFRSRI